VFCLAVFLVSCNDCDCFEDPNLVAPLTITAPQNGPFELLPYQPENMYIGLLNYPYGSNVLVAPGYTVINRFFSLRRTDMSGNPILFFWNEQNYPPFHPENSDPTFLPPIEGETITFHTLVFNNKFGDLKCIFEDAKTVSSVLDLRVAVENGQVIGEQTIVENRFNVPAGTSALFEFDFEYQGNAVYNFNLSVTGEGIIEIDTLDNNYSIALENLGLIP
jgi:hypothetical protein